MRIESKLNQIEKVLDKLVGDDTVLPTTWYRINLSGHCPVGPENCPLEPEANMGLVFTICENDCPYRGRGDN